MPGDLFRGTSYLLLNTGACGCLFRRLSKRICGAGPVCIISRSSCGVLPGDGVSFLARGPLSTVEELGRRRRVLIVKDTGLLARLVRLRLLSRVAVYRVPIFMKGKVNFVKRAFNSC